MNKICMLLQEIVFFSVCFHLIILYLIIYKYVFSLFTIKICKTIAPFTDLSTVIIYFNFFFISFFPQNLNLNLKKTNKNIFCFDVKNYSKKQ